MKKNQVIFSGLILAIIAGCAPTSSQSENSFSADGSETKTTSSTWEWSNEKRGVKPPKQADPSYNPSVPPIQQQ